MDKYIDQFYRIWEGPFAFTRENIKLRAPCKPGLYMILYNNNIAYIGRASKSIYDRLSRHFTGHGNASVARRTDPAGYTFVYFPCDDKEAREIESHVITMAKPPYNTQPEYKHFIANVTVH